MQNQSTVSLETIINFVLDRVSKQTKTPRENLRADTALASVGVDSLVAVLLCGYLEDEYELELEPIVMFEHKTAEQVANAILELMSES